MTSVWTTRVALPVGRHGRGRTGGDGERGELLGVGEEDAWAAVDGERVDAAAGVIELDRLDGRVADRVAVVDDRNCTKCKRFGGGRGEDRQAVRIVAAVENVEGAGRGNVRPAPAGIVDDEVVVARAALNRELVERPGDGGIGGGCEVILENFKSRAVGRIERHFERVGAARPVAPDEVPGVLSGRGVACIVGGAGKDGV